MLFWPTQKYPNRKKLHYPSHLRDKAAYDLRVKNPLTSATVTATAADTTTAATAIAAAIATITTTTPTIYRK